MPRFIHLLYRRGDRPPTLRSTPQERGVAHDPSRGRHDFHPAPGSPPPQPSKAVQRATLVQKRTLTVLVITQIVGTVGVGVAPRSGAVAGEVTDNEAWAGLARTASTLGAALLVSAREPPVRGCSPRTAPGSCSP